MRIAFATSNPHKVREVRALLAPFGVDVAWRRGSLIEPQAASLQQVVRAKLAQVHPSPLPVLVEDSGIFLEGLGGFPGVYSRYVYETIGLDGILRLLNGKSRRATFRTVAGLRDRRSVRMRVGEVRGVISSVPAGTNGFGYDPIFIPDGYRETFGELSPAVKNSLSHRARAIRGIGRAIGQRG